MVEPCKIFGAYLPCPKVRNVAPVTARNRLGARVGRATDMPVPGTRGIDVNRQSQMPSLQAKRRLRERRTANVAQTDQQDANHVQPRIPQTFRPPLLPEGSVL